MQQSENKHVHEYEMKIKKKITLLPPDEHRFLAEECPSLAGIDGGGTEVDGRCLFHDRRLFTRDSSKSSSDREKL